MTIRLTSPVFDRNHAPITDALAPYLSTGQGVVLEIGSGSGQHILHFSKAFPTLDWQPSDVKPDNITSIDDWRRDGGENLRPALAIDAAKPLAEIWGDRPAPTAMLSCNVIHVAPFSVLEGIVAGAAAILDTGGLLIFYGPFRENGTHTGDGNRRFDEALRAEDPSWGIRDIGEITALASNNGDFGAPEIRVMPSNNRMLVFERL